MTVNIGVAAHIHAASPGGCRYDPHMTSEQRSDEANGIWLCQTCAKLIDNDAVRFPAEMLYQWKHTAEEAALRDLSRRPSTLENVSVDSAMVPANLYPPVTIELNLDHTLNTSTSDFEKILTRLGIAAVNHQCIPINVVYIGLLEYVDKVLDDPIEKESYVRGWADRAQRIANALERMYSPPVWNAWYIWLGHAKQLQIVALEIIRLVGIGGMRSGKKIDVWRTESPKIEAPVHLSSDEMSLVLAGFGFNSEDDLRMGAGWRAADELPQSIIVGRVIPGILLAFDRNRLPIDIEGSNICQLASWHIGLG